MEQEISLLDLWKIIRKHLAKIIVATAIGVMLSLSFMFLFVSETYRSTAQLLVNQKNNPDQSSVQLNEIQSSVQLISTYRDILQGEAVLKQVSERLGGIMKVSELRDSINVEQSQNSQAFNVSVDMGDPELAQKTLAELVSVFEDTVSDVYGSKDTNIYILSPASYNPNKVAPRTIIFALIGAFMGMGASLVAVFIIEISDNTVKDDEFMASLGLVNLGQVYQQTKKDLKHSREAVKAFRPTDNRKRERV